MISVERTLVDKEKVELNGKKAYRLFFYDHTTGIISSVISYIEDGDIVLNEPNGFQPEEPEVSLEDGLNAI